MTRPDRKALIATSDGCSCSTTLAGPLASCTGAHCCASYECECRAEPCDSWETEVPECSSSVLSCHSDQERINSCN